METIIFKPQNICSREFRISHENKIITNVVIIGGCPGNLQAISSLLVGMNIDDAISKLQGIKCPGSRTKTTSCPDQISLALKTII